MLFFLAFARTVFLAPERRIEQKSTAQYPDGHFVSPYKVLAVGTENSTSFILRIDGVDSKDLQKIRTVYNNCLSGVAQSG